MNGNRINRLWDWDPWREMRRISNDLNRMFDRYPSTTEREYPLINLWSGREDIVLTAELPGVEPADLDISVQGDTVTLRGSRNPYELKEGETYHRQERGSGSFVRSMQLPFEIDAEGVKARLDKGILCIHLPRSEQDKPKKIDIKSF
ncbi:MAG: Hsp20/alpha crystallin family protein [Sedimentisphaerales bacterium]|nr:Hsp20/alpha crystallin family protein [Sedimentisphaerales bacterium]